MLLLWGVQQIRGVCHLDMCLLFRVVRVLFCAFWNLHSRRRKGAWRYHNGWCTGTLGGLFECVSEIRFFLWWSFFLVRSKTSSLGTAVWKCHIFRISELADIRLMEFWLQTMQSLLLTEQAGIEVTLKECIEEVPGEIFSIKDGEVFTENLAPMTEFLHDLSLFRQMLR